MGLDDVEISYMTLEDIDDVMVVEKLSFTIPWSKNALIEEVLNNRMAIYITAKVNGKAIGYAGMWKIFDEGHITNIAVHPEYRQNGIGSRLVEKLVDIAKERGIVKMTLEVRKSNLAAQALYCKYGFKEMGLRKGYYADNGEDAIIMWKEDIL
ncbi:MAG TPA: ribosomal-protein-alanine N-acetyltransferase [Hungateiclostridium thermocellum]|jgi:ribosomal-protein-alanine N-acetyltransferase|uniref:[Ribosomal protein bS18]-alanine N-acetyltransferase n=2 Tax=Acetivibrio thermocellus TaxID=1515 RepID=A3DGB6_ACET2|nr:ribosomal protein S18-alanine N-acetyltransferase [Acetivibrio thermocellus]CDG36298.1 30S ribosomal protein S18P alanine acetyltransferase [Acetivibrio thermocellus BC1]ABN52995.1 ribosomal-protein-alanine acetyltransferase [Acetivibrio thermocellus ATCC 27405]ADU75461.1 ribosomal-protein-alanine acetyltransferase [Acetivibrio thermocellus DSM 1313]ALX09461.1 ribosomal-protein-alanine acetyltransferase [Acetivibrio thermocellus AD2]ANV77215.1 ribosomal-protein-alanine acetyltransferase [Ac